MSKAGMPGVSGGAWQRLVRRLTGAAVREMEQHRRTVREEQEEVRRRGEEFDRKLQRGLRPDGEEFRL